MAHLQDGIQENVQYIQKIEVFNEEDINIWVGKASFNSYILGEMCRPATEKVTRVETQLALHEVIV